MNNDTYVQIRVKLSTRTRLKILAAKQRLKTVDQLIAKLLSA
jgi:hypothetical protein